MNECHEPFPPVREPSYMVDELLSTAADWTSTALRKSKKFVKFYIYVDGAKLPWLDRLDNAD
jgi:hypothetical protein